MIQGILGRKIGMSQYFEEDGSVLPVTLIKAGPCTVTQVKTEDTDGYESVQLGFEPRTKSGGKSQKASNRNNTYRCLREVPASDLNSIEIGQVVNADICEEWQHVNVTGISKGKGFQGTIKRHGFSAGPRTHGQSDRRRAPGSIGAGTFPGRVLKGKPMAGHMGSEKSTILNLQVVKTVPEKDLLLIKGSVPGGPNGLLLILNKTIDNTASN